MAGVKKLTKWWWPWQSEKVEAMLEGMASQGWILAKTGGSLTSFEFRKDQPARVRYCVDFQQQEKPEYLALLGDAGWKLEYKGSGWYLWSMAYDDVRPELYSDMDSLIRRSNAILSSMAVVFFMQIPVWIACLNNLDNPTPATVVGYALWGVFTAALGGVVIGTALGVRKLKRRKAGEAIRQG